MTANVRDEFNSKIKPKFRKAHTPQCAKCMRFFPWNVEKMVVHHKKMIMDGGTNDDDNLIVLCADCHNEWHNYFDESMTFTDWLQKPPMWMYGLAELMPDEGLKKEFLNILQDPGRYAGLKNEIMVRTPFIDENKEYTKRHSHEWIDW